MTKTPHVSASATRWGLLVTTIVLGLVLVITSLIGYLGAEEQSRSVARARGIDLALSVRRAVRQSGGDPQAALEAALEEMDEQGLRFAVIVQRDRGIVARAGLIESSLDVGRWQEERGRTEPEAELIGDVVRVVVPFAVAGEAGRPWREKVAKRVFRKLGATPMPHAGGFLVLEFEPVVERAIINRALVMLVISVASATVLLIVAVIFWRLSRKAERLGEQLARDRQLKALGEMSAVLGHELRNPLAALKGHAQLLAEILGKADHPGKRGADTVVREALRMEKLIEQILEFARTGAVARLPEQPGEVARSAVEETGSSAIDLFVAEGLPAWPLDRLRIERVLVNLLKNALQASPDDGVVDLSVRAERGGLLFEVRDRGEGLPPGEEEWIFEPFHTKRVRGTGLGLAVSKRIVEAHGGEISATNHPEGGALFRVWLPPKPAAES